MNCFCYEPILIRNNQSSVTIRNRLDSTVFVEIYVNGVLLAADVIPAAPSEFKDATFTLPTGNYEVRILDTSTGKTHTTRHYVSENENYWLTIHKRYSRPGIDIGWRKK